MNFFKFAEKVAGFVGVDLVLHYIIEVKSMYDQYKTVGETVDYIKTINKGPQDGY